MNRWCKGLGLGLGWGLAVTSLGISGCEDVIDLDPVDERPVIERSVRPKPISGGTLIVTSDGTAVAADPDRDVVHVVDIDARAVRHTVALQSGDEPGRVAAGTEGLAHVVLRGAGGIATIDLLSGEVTSRQWLCPDPRGIAFDDTDATLHVACADGTLVQLSEATGQELERLTLAPDLRDVFFFQGQRYISQFRSATITTPEGGELATDPPLPFGSQNAAWRTLATETTIVQLHHLSSVEPIPIEPAPEEVEGGDHPYGGGGGPNPCAAGIVTPAVTLVQGTDVPPPPVTPLFGAPLTVDVALSEHSGQLALAMPGAEEGTSTLAITGIGNGCVPPNVAVEGQVTAVAFSDEGVLVAQSREPAALFIKSATGGLETIALEGESVYDTGHEIFHRATESGLSCASCHPEGTDDGHVWNFETLGPRRTQPLDIGLEGTAPFHWDGDMDDLDMIMDEVLSHRMGGMRQSPPRADSFARWMFELEGAPAAMPHADEALVQRGEALFSSMKCTSCHTGAKLGGLSSGSIRGMELQVPSLRRVSLRPPYMHDGRAATLEEAAVDMILTTTSLDPQPGDAEALAAYMRTL